MTVARKAERLRFWASILELPYRDCERSKDFPNGRMRPAVEANILAAEAMRFMADTLDEQPGVLAKIIKFCDECSDPHGWLATNVRYTASRAPGQSTRTNDTEAKETK